MPTLTVIPSLRVLTLAGIYLREPPAFSGVGHAVKRPKAAFLPLSPQLSREQILTIQQGPQGCCLARDTEQREQCPETLARAPVPEETHQAHEADGTSTALVKANSLPLPLLPLNRLQAP